MYGRTFTPSSPFALSAVSLTRSEPPSKIGPFKCLGGVYRCQLVQLVLSYPNVPGCKKSHKSKQVVAARLKIVSNIRKLQIPWDRTEHPIPEQNPAQ